MSQLKVRRKKNNLKSKKQKTDNYLYLLWKALAESKTLSWYHGHTNASCLCCNSVAKEMIRTGALVFCVECFTNEFDASAPERDKEVYRKWLDIQSDKWDKDLE